MSARTVLLLPLAVLLTSTSDAAFDVSAVHVGGFFEDGTADNDAAVFQNYYVGYSTSSKVEVRRNFFIFDLSAVTAPVSSASLALTLKFGGVINGVESYGPEPDYTPTFEIEEFNLSGAPLSAYPMIGDPSIDAGTGMSYFGTFGDPGGSIGGFVFDPDDPSPPMPGEIVIDLGPAGVDLINLNLGGAIVVTGRMLDVTPLSPDPDGPGPLDPEMSEILWGFTDVFGGPAVTDMPFLSLESVPEPGAFGFILGFACFGWMATRRRSGINR